MKNPRDIKEVVAGTLYEVPNYMVTDDSVKAVSEDEFFINAGISQVFCIPFCREDKSNSTIPRQNGVLIESLLEVCRQRLTAVNVGDLATRETAVAITKIDEAIMWLEKRSNDRKIRNVEGTYKK